MKLTSSELTSIRALIAGYRQSAAYLTRSADELDELLRNSEVYSDCLLYTSPSPRDKRQSRMPSSA